MATKSKNISLSGGRPPKIDKEKFGQITCVLRLDTIEQLKEGSGSKHFGEFLQHHLDRYPPPSREQYLALKKNGVYYETYKGKKIPVLVARTAPEVAARKAARKAQRDAALLKKTTKELVDGPYANRT